MSGGKITREELNLSLESIAASNRTTSDCLEKLTESVAIIEKYMIHNDYRHSATESVVRENEETSREENRIIRADLAMILKIMEERKPLWSAFKKSKLILSTLVLGAMTAAGAGIYNYLVKPQPVISNNKETLSTKIKPVTRDLIK